ncbi:hypothetical protein LMI99_24390, partial [Klebsiella pneumoniae]|nr:hypothetical protein [Klebsiella pneumoniae]
MTKYKTNNPLGSAAVKDLYDNAENLDVAINSITLAIWKDRLGKERKTWHGIESDFATQIASQRDQFATQITAQKSQFEGQISEQHDQFTAQITGQRDEFNDMLAASGYSWLKDYVDGPVTFTN